MTRRPLLLLLLAAAALTCLADNVDPQLRQTIRFEIMRQFGNMERIEISQHPEQADIYAVTFDRQARWSGEMTVCRLTNGQILGIATFAEGAAPDGEYVQSAEWRRFPGIGATLLEVFDGKRSKDGGFRLYSVVESVMESRVLARVPPSPDGRPVPEFTNVVSGAVFRDGQMRPRYTDLNGDGLEDIVLTGVRPPDRGSTNTEPTLLSHILIWNPATARFEEP